MYLFKKIRKCTFKIFFFILTIFFFVSCQKSSHPLVKDDEKIWIGKFFKDLFLEEGAIYTLWGSKPITRIILYEYSEEEVDNYNKSLTQNEIKNSRIRMNYDLPVNWKKWKAIEDRFPMKRYMLFEAKWHDDPEVKFIYFVDILKTALILQEYYEEFRKVVGFDFNPVKEVYKMKEDDPIFWKKLNSSLWGLLFGYGKHNSYAFYWKNFDHTRETENFFTNLEGKSSNNQGLIGNQNRTLKNLGIPSFISFFSNDPVVEEYQKEKEFIQKTYKHRCFIKKTIDRLLE